MDTNKEEKDRLRFIINNLIAGDSDWFDKHNIHVSKKKDYWMLNYAPGPRNDYNKLVRGMVVRRPVWGKKVDSLTLISSFPFVRFFNHGEKDAEDIALHHSELLEKLDGTMVGIFFPDYPITFRTNPSVEEGEVAFHTRKMLSLEENDYNLQITTFHGKKYHFLPTIAEYVKKLRFNETDLGHTYVFEFIHEVSHVVTKYTPEAYGLYLIGARQLTTHLELTEDELDVLAERIGARRPRRWLALQHKEIMVLMKEEGQDFEGFVFRDKLTGKRVKLKDTDYLRKHRLLDATSYKNLLPIILMGEEEEILAYFPFVKERVDEVKKAYESYLKKTTTAVLKWRGMDRKEVAMAIFHREEEPDQHVRNMVMRFLDESNPDTVRHSIDKELKKIALGSGNNAGSPKRLLEIIDLQDVSSKTDTEEL